METKKTTKKVNDPMSLWKLVCKTDPKYTKKVSIGKKYTSICPQYQIEMARTGRKSGNDGRHRCHHGPGAMGPA